MIGTGPSHPSTTRPDAALTTIWKPSPGSMQKHDEAEQLSTLRRAGDAGRGGSSGFRRGRPDCGCDSTLGRRGPFRQLRVRH